MKRQGSASKKATTTSRASRKTATSRVQSASMSSAMSGLRATTSSSASPRASGVGISTAESFGRSTAIGGVNAKRAFASTANRRSFAVASSSASENITSFAAAPTRRMAAVESIAAKAPVAAPVATFSSKVTKNSPMDFATAAPSVKFTARQNTAEMKKVVMPSIAMGVESSEMMNAVPAVANTFRPSFKTLDREVPPQSLSPQKVVFQAQKFMMNDVAGLQKEFKTDLNDTLDNLGIQVTVNEDGVITATFKRRGFDIEAVYDREFQFPEEYDEDEDYAEGEGDEKNSKRRGSGSGSEGEDYEDETPEPFHNITFSIMKDGQTLKMGGTLGLDGDLRITSFTPYTKRGEELRTVATEDLSDATLNALFDALEMICLQDETTNALLDVARQERIKTHIDALTWMNEFFDLGDYH